MRSIRNAAVAAIVAAMALAAGAQDVEKIRKNLAERLPLLGKIDEVAKTPMPGLFEVRVGSDLFYTDDKGDFLIQGSLIDAKGQKNLTEERQEKLLMIPFDQLPLKDAFTIVRGNGKRRIAVFEDPNCPYCKHFERDMQKINDVTVYMFLYPILGPDSTDKSKNLWCAKDRGGAWLDWMLRGKAAPGTTCDIAAVTRNVEFGKKHKISGTPTMIMADGSRVAGAMPAADIEKLLAGKQ
ncbi:MAG TPA: DsbC family protein [Ramlibacter sp.]|nr:DsbC family protein [Ramlibacter sp.]